MNNAFKKRISYMNAAELLDKIFDVYKRSFWHQIGLSFCVNIISGFLAYIALFVVVLARATSVAIGIRNNGVSIPLAAALTFVALAVIWLFWVCFSLKTAAINFLSWQAYSGRPIDIGLALSSAFKSLWRIATVSLAEIIACAPVLAIIVFGAYAIFAPLGVFTVGFWVDIFFVSGMLRLLIVFFIILFIIILIFIIIFVLYNYFALALPIAIFDHRHFFSAMAESYRLLKGDFWRVLGTRAAFSGGLALATASLTGIGVLIVGMSAGLSNSFGPNRGVITIIGMIANYMVSFAAGTVISPLGGVFTSILFFNQKIKKEGLDLAMRLEALESANGI